jgi:hypothetical protein
MVIIVVSVIVMIEVVICNVDTNSIAPIQSRQGIAIDLTVNK